MFGMTQKRAPLQYNTNVPQRHKCLCGTKYKGDESMYRFFRHVAKNRQPFQCSALRCVPKTTLQCRVSAITPRRRSPITPPTRCNISAITRRHHAPTIWSHRRSSSNIPRCRFAEMAPTRSNQAAAFRLSCHAAAKIHRSSPFFQKGQTMFSKMSLSATRAMNSLFVGFSVPIYTRAPKMAFTASTRPLFHATSMA